MLPAVLVYLATCFLVFATLYLMTGEINRVDEDRARKAITSAVDFARQQLSGRVADESNWTEAYINTYVSLNRAWLDDTWGATARNGIYYDSVAVTDFEGNILFGESTEGPFDGNIAARIDGGEILLEQLSDMLSNSGDGIPVVGLTSANDGVAIAALAAINGSSGRLSIAAEDRRLLLLMRNIGDDELNQLARQLQVPLPRYERMDRVRPDERAVALTGLRGEPLPALVWRPLRPGDAALVQTAGIALLVLVCLGVLGLMVLTAFRGSVERRAEVDARDWVNARFDTGTGLLNQFGLEESVASIAVGPKATLPVAIAYIELEGLKNVAGNYGHQIAEALLNRLAALLDVAIGDQAAVARLGPDEFAICRTGDDAGEKVREFAGLVMDILAQVIAVDDLRLKLGASIGIAEADTDPRFVGDVVDMAAAAMQRARETGGNHIVEYEPAIERDRQERLALQSDIRHGLDADEFDLAYQPIFDFSTQAMSGVEALLRWPRRPAGALSPAAFIPAAEASGLIEELGLFALRRACIDIGALPGLKLSVNVSTVQFRSPALVSRIEAILAAAAFPAERLQLEITESLLIAQPERARQAIDELRGRGISIALDDFGTGFSSIGYLRQFQFDRVKLDRSLVSDVDLDPAKLALVESTMAFAFAMGLAVTAEGTERREEAAALARLGCREFQGYLFAKPLPLSGLRRLLEPPAEQRRSA